MNSFAPTLQSFFTEWLVRQRQVSQHTVAAYRDTFRLLLAFAQQATGRAPSQLDWDNLDAPLIAAFLEHLETERHNSIRTRNARLAAVHSLFRFAALRHPEHAALIQRVLAMPQKRGERNLVAFLEQHEIDALLAAPDRSRCGWGGVIMQCSCWPSRRACASRRSLLSLARTRDWAPGHTFGVVARAAKSGLRR